MDYKGENWAQQHWSAGPKIIPNDFHYTRHKKYSLALIFAFFNLTRELKTIIMLIKATTHLYGN